MSLREPLVPPEVDLRDFPYMPVDIVRLFGSDFHAQADDTAWRAGMTLWLKAYHQVPAGSVPDDDVALARLAEFGRDVKSWNKVKAAAMRGWVKCSDGRSYHPVVSEKALEAWIEKLNQRKSSGAGNAKRYGLKFDAAPLDACIQDCLRRLSALNPNSRTLSKRLAKPSQTPPDDLPPGDTKPPDGSPVDLPSGSQGKGREGIEEKKEDKSSPPALQPEPDQGGQAGLSPEFFRRIRQTIGDEPCRNDPDLRPLATLLAEGCTEEDLINGIAVALAKSTERIRHWTAFGGWVRIAREDRLAGPRQTPKPDHAPHSRKIPLKHNIMIPVSEILRTLVEHRPWPEKSWGPPPGKPGCLVPESVLSEVAA